jgi:acetyl-CoA carboxylase biotin carboxyl carrier protein
MEFEEIKELIKLIQKSKISEFKYENESAKISIRTKSYSAGKEVIVQQPSVVSAGMPMPVMQQPQQNTTAPVANKEAKEEKAAAPAEESSKYIEVTSPMVGTFYRSPSPEKGPFVKVGDTINIDDTICLIEAMKLFNEVKAEVSGKIVKMMVEDASPIEYGQVLFLVDPS